MSKFYYIRVFALVFLFLSFSGCPGSVKKYPIQGSEWKLETLNGKSVTLKGGNYITLNFEGSGEKLNGTAVCNKYSGEYLKKEDSLTFLNIAATKMLCDDDINESDYFNALGKVDRYKISEGKLRLIGKDSVVAIYKQ